MRASAAKSGTTSSRVPVQHTTRSPRRIPRRDRPWAIASACWSISAKVSTSSPSTAAARCGTARAALRNTVPIVSPGTSGRLDILEYAHGVHGGVLVGEVTGSLGGLDEPAGGAHRQDLDERKAQPLLLNLQRALDHLLRPVDVHVAVDRAPCDVGDALQPG